MDRVLGQPPAVLRNEKTILAVEETTSAGRCGSSLAAFYVLRSSAFAAVWRGAFLIIQKEVT